MGPSYLIKTTWVQKKVSRRGLGDFVSTKYSFSADLKWLEA